MHTTRTLRRRPGTRCTSALWEAFRMAAIRRYQSQWSTCHVCKILAAATWAWGVFALGPPVPSQRKFAYRIYYQRHPLKAITEQLSLDFLFIWRNDQYWQDLRTQPSGIWIKMHMSTEAIVAIISLGFAAPYTTILLWKFFKRRSEELRSSRASPSQSRIFVWPSTHNIVGVDSRPHFNQLSYRISSYGVYGFTAQVEVALEAGIFDQQQRRTSSDLSF